MKNTSSIEVVNIACDSVVLVWRRMCLLNNNKYQNTKKQPCRYKKFLPIISKQYMDNNME